MIIVTGAKGMLGRQVVEECDRTDRQVLALGHAEINIADAWQVFNWAQAWTKDDVLINCAGIPGDIAEPWEMMSANALGPHILARAAKQFGFKLIHVSTDCVFSGWDRQFSPRMRTVGETPNPDTFYGRTKLAGEPSGQEVSVVRTSFVGPDHGLMSWIIDQPMNAQVTGWMDAWWSGSTARAVAEALVNGSFRRGLHHLCTEKPITKLEAVQVIAKHFGRDDLDIVATRNPIDRSLSSSSRTGYLPSLADALEVKHG